MTSFLECIMQKFILSPFNDVTAPCVAYDRIINWFIFFQQSGLNKTLFCHLFKDLFQDLGEPFMLHVTSGGNLFLVSPSQSFMFLFTKSQKYLILIQFGCSRTELCIFNMYVTLLHPCFFKCIKFH